MSEIIRFTLRIVKALNDLLEREAKQKGIAKNALIIEILWDYVNKKSF